MEDIEVIEAFVQREAKKAFGPTLHVEGGDILMLNGWWHVSVRLDPSAFIVRNEPPSEPSPVLEDMAAVLGRQGLEEVAVDLPLIQAVTYSHLSLGDMSWALWATDLDAGHRALVSRAGADSFLTDAAFASELPGEVASKDFSAELGGARRLAGLPPSVILTVGLPREQTDVLQGAFSDCRLDTRSFDDIDPSACGSIIPTVVIVDARQPEGREFIMELRVDACGRFLPVVAVTEDAGPPPGADEVLDPRQDPAHWVGPLRALMP